MKKYLDTYQLNLIGKLNVLAVERTSFDNSGTEQECIHKSIRHDALGKGGSGNVLTGVIVGGIAFKCADFGK